MYIIANTENSNENIILPSIFLILLCFSCQSKQAEQPTPPISKPKNKISFVVDTIKVYPAESIPANNFIFSPAGDLDKIWAVSGNNINELDLITGDWTSLSWEYNKRAKARVLKTGVLPDTLKPWLYDKHDSLANRLPGKHYQTFKDQQLKWHFSPKYLFVSDTLNQTYQFEHLPTGYLRGVKNDDQYLYLFFDGKFIILNKNFVLKNTTLFDIDDFQAKKIKIEGFTKDLYTLKLDSFLSAYHQIKSDTTLLAIPENAERCDKAFRAYFTNFQNNEALLKETENAIREKTLPAELEPHALLPLSRYYLRRYNVPKFKLYVNQFFSTYPQVRGVWYQNVIECSSKLISKIDSLASLNLPKGEWLHKEALLKMKLVECGAFSDNYYNYSIVYDNYKELLEKYPNSSYAANAELFSLSMHFDYDEGDLTYSEEIDNQLQAFILKYPNSPLKVNAQLLRSNLYVSHFGDFTEDIKFLEKGLAILESINLQEVRDSNLFSSFEHQKLATQRELAKRVFEITVTPTADTFKLTDKEMIFTVKVKNKSAKERSLQLFQSSFPFSIYLYAPQHYPFNKDLEAADSNWLTQTIPSNDSIVHQLDLRSTVRQRNNHYGSSLGHYTFDTIGVCYLTVFSVDDIVNSEQISFQLAEN